MEILVFISVATTFFFVGWTMGRSTVVSSEGSREKAEEHFKNGYIKGYMDASEIERGKQYYDNFPQMGAN
jgi:uncharacterized membrane protein